MKYLILFSAFFFSLPAYSQITFRGIVIDSASFEELPGVIIHVKSSERRTISSAVGQFTISANHSDTLVITMLGYQPIELPLLYEEDVMLIRLSEQIRLLDEITIRATRLYPNEIVNRTKTAPKRVSALEGVFSPFDYFWKLEREKRKLARIIEENNKAQTYVQVITDPVVKEIMMKAYDLTELTYYERLAIKKKKNTSISYSTDPEEIMEALHNFFLGSTKGK